VARSSLTQARTTAAAASSEVVTQPTRRVGRSGPRSAIATESGAPTSESAGMIYYRDMQEELYEFAVPHLQSGRLALDETVVDGFEHIVDAFLGMLRGRSTGKIIVRLGYASGRPAVR
jgi:hypothetical protein